MTIASEIIEYHVCSLHVTLTCRLVYSGLPLSLSVFVPPTQFRLTACAPYIQILIYLGCQLHNPVQTKLIDSGGSNAAIHGAVCRRRFLRAGVYRDCIIWSYSHDVSLVRCRDEGADPDTV
ncbi:hypothetical protein Mapa_004850 [Marchantia paleacea]|nr:hypothetical protein Mapa_004850 [Marchantia paleacea]